LFNLCFFYREFTEPKKEDEKEGKEDDIASVSFFKLV
jgi:hypothetical protein